SPFAGTSKTETLHGLKDLLPLTQVEKRGRAATEKNSARFQVLRNEFQFACHCLNISIDDFSIGSLGIEGAIGAFVRAKRYVHVKTGNRLIGQRTDHEKL